MFVSLLGVHVAWVPGEGGSYTLEARIPFANFPGLSGGDPRSIGFALALNDVDRLVPGAQPDAAATSDPGTYLSWNRGFLLYRKPKNFGRLDLPARATSAPVVPAESAGSPALWVAVGAVVLAGATATAIIVATPPDRRGILSIE